ncbi:MAG: methyltransferase [Pseudohongiellaceae bacterium]
MAYELPVVDDTLAWNAMLVVYKVPALAVAIELDIFESLDAEPDSPEGLAGRRDFDLRALRALLPMLMNLGFLREHGGRYQLSEAGRHYMLKRSPFFWGHVFTRQAANLGPTRLLKETVNRERERAAVQQRPVDSWEAGNVDMELARSVTAYMHSHSMPAAVGMTHTFDFSRDRRVLDVGGGSGCFSIALAAADAERRCTVMELPTICLLAQEYIAEAGLSDRIDTVTVDMCRAAWPEGYDAHFFSNIFHDWGFDTCLQLARSSHAALPAGGRILLHEMLLDDSTNTPPHAVAFSLLMAMGTKGQQFSFPQLREILQEAGFRNISCQPTYGYYSIVSGEK